MQIIAVGMKPSICNIVNYIEIYSRDFNYFIMKTSNTIIRCQKITQAIGWEAVIVTHGVFHQQRSCLGAAKNNKWIIKKVFIVSLVTPLNNI